ncbi:methyltransferase [Acinetobacter gyllenbergii]|uniref:DNA adenine methylase n=1 Tax=Acinetobacter gyllenbergii CIP 110306 = MTCC 11365 TaxID=1217657 RepID=A0A829HCD2_9GAMM|nr:DNA adenine methylase [Acinetobacter gyllenbergii]EPF72577.1 DNA adenine methylase [Acinetobacter gyllenbergii CIP 110306 = MTCC 11365]EPH31099.1 Putative methyltransferase [Acinetobacter gyllenbergii CIP 110306 = MTCC 11365]GMA12778.1 methyltransferase [Acinetobacter gyllenbergii]
MKHPLIRYHGGKFRLAHWIISNMPNHVCYTEAFGGAAGVLLQKPRSYADVYNDLDGDIVNLFEVLRDSNSREQLVEQLVLTPYSRADFENAWEQTENKVERARRVCIRAQMGFGSAGATKGITGFRIDTKRQYGTAQSLWVNYPEHLSLIGQRLSGVLIENRPAVQVLKDHDSESTLHYVDPPYVMDTRYDGAQTGRIYRHEMSDQDHQELLETMVNLNGMVMLSGYASDLYDEFLVDWKRLDMSARISAGRGTALRTECLWLNPAAQGHDLFGVLA